jgi:hypothetical protein
MEGKYFPIKTATACQLKWAWSTIYLNTGITASCHRTGASTLTAENFKNFHNTPLKQEERARMLQGEWPENSCSYCKNIEETGGVSDRIRMSAIPGLSPLELENNPTALSVDPTLVEVYFNNTCNLGCLYCNETLSSVIAQENLKYGSFNKFEVKLNSDKGNGQFKNLVPYFWQWFETGFQKIKRLHVLGGEPFYQQEVDKLIEMIDRYPNPECELNIITNLMLDRSRLEKFVAQFRLLLVNRKLKRIDITCSIDCWGPEQEYVRWGLNIKQWQDNFEFLLKKKWLTININQTITPLTIKTMPELLAHLAEWRKQRPIGHFFSSAEPAPPYFKCDIFDGNIFKNEIDDIMSSMPAVTEQDQLAISYMQGILAPALTSKLNKSVVQDLITYLDENDRRRGTDWQSTFTWLKEYKQYVV